MKICQLLLGCLTCSRTKTATLNCKEWLLPNMAEFGGPRSYCRTEFQALKRKPDNTLKRNSFQRRSFTKCKALLVSGSRTISREFFLKSRWKGQMYQTGSTVWILANHLLTHQLHSTVPWVRAPVWGKKNPMPRTWTIQTWVQQLVAYEVGQGRPRSWRV